MYYSIQHSINTKIVGKFMQSEFMAYNYEYVDNPKFLNNIYFEKINFTPITPKPILHKKAKLTDLISNVNSGGNLHLILSEKLKNIIEKYNNDRLQFFETKLIQNDKEYVNYYSLNMFASNFENIDFKNSETFYYKQKPDYEVSFKREKILLDIENQIDFFEYVNDAKVKAEILCIEKLCLIKNIEVDFFMLRYVEGGVKYIVSKKLKQEIEDTGCTGIEFQPVELSLNEWLMPGGEREKIYGKA